MKIEAGQYVFVGAYVILILVICVGFIRQIIRNKRNDKDDNDNDNNLFI